MHSFSQRPVENLTVTSYTTTYDQLALVDDVICQSGNTLVSGSYDHTIKLWDLESNA